MADNLKYIPNYVGNAPTSVDYNNWYKRFNTRLNEQPPSKFNKSPQSR